MTTIYLSSAYEDLKDYREVVYKALRQSGYHVIAMEDYVATDQRPVEKCLRDVQKADLYVGLFAFRYGYIPPPEHKNSEGLSVTELEYRHAEGLKKPCLTFIAKENAGIPLKFVDAYTGHGDKGKHVERLRQYLLTEKLASGFSAPHELAALVLAAVTNHLAAQNNLMPSLAQEPASPASVTWDIDKLGSPYPGLMHFTRKYAPVFFGRDVEVRAVLDHMRLSEGRFVLISGNSGVGKSSIVDAGVLPNIERTPLPCTATCLCVRMIPSQGRHPFNALMSALHPYTTRAGLSPESIEKDLVTTPSRLPYHLRTILSGIEHDALVLFVDQMEELFTTHDPGQSKAFVTALTHATHEGALWVLATIRSDHLHHCHGHPDLLKILRGPGHYPVGPIEPYMLPDLIVKPARCAGLRVTDELARRIVHDMGAEQGHLPLLAFVLDDLFRRRSNHELSEAVYKQSRGINGAIRQHAARVEATIQEDRGALALVLLSTLFQSLVIVDTEGLPTRRRPLRSAFSGEIHRLIDVFVRERLLQTEGEGETATVSISHEALFEAWPSLKTYIAGHRKQLMDQTLLEGRARKWEEMGKPWFSGLAIGREYQDFQRAATTATATMKEYLHFSRRLRSLIYAAVGVVMVAVGLTTWLWQKAYSVEQAMLKLQSFVVSIHVMPEMQPIPAGSFRQGDIYGRGGRHQLPQTNGNITSAALEQPVHGAIIKPFAIGKFEVTFDEYDRFAIATGRPLPGDQGWGRGRRPVINVSWHDATEYANWLSRQTNKRYRLPTESEWEYAARGGGHEEIWAVTSDEKQLRKYAVYMADRTAPVGQDKGRQPNALGLYDVSGNVWEWVKDCAHVDYQGAPTDGMAWQEADGGNCEGHMIRGGSWTSDSWYLRASVRLRFPANFRNVNLGLRLAQDIS